MRSAVILLAVVSAVVAEAPYHLPRPAPHAPAFVHPSGPAPPPPPAPFPQLPQPRPQQPFAPFPHQPAPPPSFSSHQGYNYQQPSFGPTFVYPQHPAPQPIPVHPSPPLVHPAPHPHPLPVHPPPPVYLPAPAPAPLPHPPSISYPQPYPQPHPVHYPAPQPQPLPINYPQPYPQPQPILPPQTSYGVPHIQPQPQPHPLPLFNYNINVPQAPQPAPIFQQQQAPQPFISSNHAHISQQHQVAHQGYSQPISQQTQFAAPLPLQSQPLTHNAVSSYQADSNQYSSAQQDQTHREALDETVVDRVQNIIKENEHSSAKHAGYLSLVSGVSLENARPSVELSSFVHTSQDNTGLLDVRSSGAASSLPSSSSSSSSSSATANLSSYDVPTISAGSSQSSDSSASLGFLPNSKPAISYGVPN